MMTLSPAGLAKIAHFEGFQSHAFWDHKGQSIGYGHLILPGESFPGNITMDEGMKLLEQDAAKAAADVNELVKVPITQDQFDALVDFRYNLGRGPLETICSTLNRHDYGYIATRIKLYDKARVNGELVVNKGLVFRRADEAKAFETGQPPQD